MTWTQVATTTLKRHPELMKILTPKQINLVHSVMLQAIRLAHHEALSQKETDAVFKKHIPDAEKPSAILRAYRKRAGLTQHELSQETEIPQSHLSAMESGKRNIGVSTAKKLSLALDVDYKKFL